MNWARRKLIKWQWPRFAGPNGMQEELAKSTDKIIQMVSEAYTTGRHANLRVNIFEELRQVWLRGGEKRMVKFRSTIRKLEHELNDGTL